MIHGTARVRQHGKCANTGLTKTGKAKLKQGQKRPFSDSYGMTVSLDYSWT